MCLSDLAHGQPLILHPRRHPQVLTLFVYIFVAKRFRYKQVWWGRR